MIWLRSAVFNVWFVAATIALGLMGLVVRVTAPHRALSVAQLWARLLLGGARIVCGVRYQVTGLEHLPKGPVLIASQHQSAFDTLVWLLIVPRVSYVYKAELGSIPLIGQLLRLSGQIALDRAGGFAAIKGLLRGAERAVDDGRQIVIFPEGTRVEHGVDVPIRPGVAALASHTGLAVIPVATDSGRLWSRKAFVKYPGLIHIAIEPALPPGQGKGALIASLQAAWRDGAAAIARCG